MAGHERTYRHRQRKRLFAGPLFKLTENEQLALVIFAQNVFYRELNDKLRDARERPAAPTLPPAFASYLCHLFRGIRKMPQVPLGTTVYRGVSNVDPAVVKENYALGRPVFWSTVHTHESGRVLRFSERRQWCATGHHLRNHACRGVLHRGVG